MRLHTLFTPTRLWFLLVGLTLGSTLAAVPARATPHPANAAPVAWTPPSGVVQVSPCVPLMGEHWAKPEDMPLGPIYTVYHGKLMAIEYMPAQADFIAGKNWNDQTFLYHGQPLAIVHADIDFQPRGHEGFEVPHYDMHYFVVSPEEKRAITCEG